MAANRMRRFMAYLLDSIIIAVIWFIFQFTGFFVQDGEMKFFGIYLAKQYGWSNIITVILLVITAIIMGKLEASFAQGSLGKQMTGIKVTDKSGMPIGFLEGVTRNSVKLLPYMVAVILMQVKATDSIMYFNAITGLLVIFSCVMVVFDNNGRSIHDLVAQTRVVNKDKQENESEKPIQVQPIDELKDAVVKKENSILETPKKVFIEAVDGKYFGIRYEVKKPIVIGRDPDKCSLLYPDKTRGISRVHCEVYIANDTLYIVDHSSQGTFVCSDAITKLKSEIPVELHENDCFYLATETEKFRVVYEKL